MEARLDTRVGVQSANRRIGFLDRWGLARTKGGCVIIPDLTHIMLHAETGQRGIQTVPEYSFPHCHIRASVCNTTGGFGNRNGTKGENNA